MSACNQAAAAEERSEGKAVANFGLHARTQLTLELYRPTLTSSAHASSKATSVSTLRIDGDGVESENTASGDLSGAACLLSGSAM